MEQAPGEAAGAERVLLVATTNRGKLKELQTLLSDLPVRLVSLAEVGISEDVEETGTTFAENARLKAETYCQLSGLPTIADDSGLEVAVLNGDPGIYTGRWALPDLDDPHRHYRRLLDALKGKPFHDRIARFVCVIALARPGHKTEFVEGTLMGVIEEQPRGTSGFGYDPVFYLLDYDKTLAELPAELKDRISHRGQAVEAARPILASWFSGPLQ